MKTKNRKSGLLTLMFKKEGGEKMMKKIFLTAMIGLTVIALAGFVGSPAMAAVTGVCSNCHTMHNSQDGIPMNFDASATPNATLLRGSCVGCHAQDTAANIVSSIPQILHSDTNDLAGGNLDACEGGSNAAGHNIEDIVVQDSTLLNVPPGYSSAYDPATTDYSDTYRLTCAGSNGCHGNRDLDRSGYGSGAAASTAGVSGAHHGADAVLKFGTINEALQGTSTANSYRFLLGIKGGEDDDWQDTEAAADHNEYKGAVFATRSTNGRETVSDLCAECHGNFHASGATGIGDASPWLRHPTDVILPNSGGYAAYNPDAANAYSVEAPVARATIPNAVSSTVAPGTDIVMCLSCHRAHGSDNADILRWDYSTMNAGTGTADTGCFTCHTDKNAD